MKIIYKTSAGYNLNEVEYPSLESFKEDMGDENYGETIEYVYIDSKGELSIGFLDFT